MASIYDQWADIYDSVYSYVQEDIPFYIEEAQDTGGPVLELGCGTGRVAIPIARAGVEVVGLDFSKAMLDVAKRKAARLSKRAASLTFIHAEMQDFSLDNKFQLAIIPFRGFQSLLTVADEVETLLNIKRHLAPGGRLVFSIFVPDLNMMVQEGDTPYHFRDVTDPATGISYVLWNQAQYDSFSQIMSIRTTIEEMDDASAVCRKLYRDFHLRYIFRWEMHHLLSSCGYEVLELFGNFDRSPFDDNSTEMVWIAAPRI
jgi:ubiquinone/menaquinone biosynthesis C-methylase UbiE